MFKMREIAGLVFLFCNAIYDLKYRKIWGKSMLFFVPLIVVLAALDKQWTMTDWWLAFIPGILFLAISWIRQEIIGMGDGICILLLGFLWEWDVVIMVCTIALIMAGILGGVLFVLKRVTRKTQIPFIPFLFMAAVMISLKG
ncbi:MAG: hypothetical protein E7299_01035 [Lachnospiraceae bacterium]|nr:hypothetical protein [Lachnospiraceae bacterium]